MTGLPMVQWQSTASRSRPVLPTKPPRLTHVEAASVPIGALTAWQGLFDRARLQAGEHVLVHGGAGAVGIFAIQLARFHGAHVTATASARNLAFVSQLGAEQVIDYRAVRFEENIREWMSYLTRSAVKLCSDPGVYSSLAEG